MSSNYSGRYENPLGVGPRGFGGAGWNLGVEALAGQTDLVTVFDDFNGVVPSETFGDAANWETMGWVLTDVGVPVADLVGMQDAADVDQWYPSCIRLFAGTTDDTGGNMQLDRVNASLPASSGAVDFPHLWIPETAAGTEILDNTVWVFACRIGLEASDATAATNWDGGLFLGWAEAGDTSIMTAGTKVITIASTGPLVGFHVNTNGQIDGISHRTVGTAMAEGTNFTNIVGTGGVDGTTANGAATAGDIMWFDLALRMNITDMSSDTANGATEFFWRRVPRITQRANTGGQLPGQGPAWAKHSVVLQNQTPNNDVALVPTIEFINGPTAGVDSVAYVDWWTFGCSRFSRLARS